MKTKLEKTVENILATIFLVAVLAALPFYNQWAYGDWTCVFKNCVQNTEKELREK